MNYSKIGVRYAKALILAASEQNKLEEVSRDMAFLDTVIKTVAEFSFILESPVIKPSEKLSIFKAAFSEQLNKISVGFIEMVVLHRRENRLTDMIRNFQDQYKLKKGILSACLTTPIAIDEPLIQKISDLLKSQYHKEISLSAKVTPEIVGGFVLQIEDLQYDSSVATQLNKIHRQLIDKQLN